MEGLSQGPKLQEDKSATGSQDPAIPKIEVLLKTKDDTSRFVGLALLKSVLDNTPEIRQDDTVLTRLWASISPKFLDRLMRTGCNQASANKDAKEMLNIAVYVIHTFATLLPDQLKRETSLSGRIPFLVHSILQRFVNMVSMFRSVC